MPNLEDEDNDTEINFRKSFGFLLVGCILLLAMFLGAAFIFMLILQYPWLLLVLAGISLWAWRWVNKPNF